MVDHIIRVILTYTCVHTHVHRAEVLAAEIKELQGEMADYNTVRLGSVERCLHVDTYIVHYNDQLIRHYNGWWLLS